MKEQTVKNTVSGSMNTGKTDYLVLVNRDRPVPENWMDSIEIKECVNTLGETVRFECRTYEAYMRLKEIMAEEGIIIQADSCLRTVKEQQEITDIFLEKYGEEYTHNTVAVPGYSEHHTGLCVDLYFVIDGVDIYQNEDTEKYPWIWERIHAHLTECGFILRYPSGKERITGYAYEPWHIRYVGNPLTAKNIMDQNLTLEEYLEEI